jgi:hypothetical protein
MGGFGLNQQGQMANASNAQSQKGSMLAGLAGLGSAAIFASDRQVKKDIHVIGEINGVKVYQFRYIDGEEAIGVMSDEVPWAAIDQGAYVDYTRVFR